MSEMELHSTAKAKGRGKSLEVISKKLKYVNFLDELELTDGEKRKVSKMRAKYPRLRHLTDQRLTHLNNRLGLINGSCMASLAFGGSVACFFVPHTFEVLVVSLATALVSLIKVKNVGSVYRSYQNRVVETRLQKMGRREFAEKNKQFELIQAQEAAYTLQAKLAQLEDEKERWALEQKVAASAPVVPTATTHSDAYNPISMLSAVQGEWLEWEMDILKVVQFPSLFDLRNEYTRTFHESLNFALSVKSALKSNEITSEFRQIVAKVQTNWQLAKDEAKRIKTSSFPTQERKRLERALSLLKVALDSSGSESERQVAYTRALKEVEGLVSIPVSSMRELESSIGMLAIEQ